MARKDFEVIPHHNIKICWTCNGTGKIDNEICWQCKGTGKFIETFYYLVYKGMCFGVDTIK